MDYEKAAEASEIISQIKLNDSDISILKNAINDDIAKAQIIIVSEGRQYHTTVYENNRLSLLLKVLYEENYNLRKRLREL